MHETTQIKIREFVRVTRGKWPCKEVADLGSLEFSGSVRDIVPNVTGFDVVDGKGVDVVLTPGRVPDEHYRRYGAVICANSFQFCAEPKAFRGEAIKLCRRGGFVMVTMCGQGCHSYHTTSANPYRWGDELRWSMPELVAFWSQAFTLVHFEQEVDGHCDMIYWGKKGTT